MSTERVRGKNVLVFIKSGTEMKLYACGRSCTLDVETEFIETSVSGSGRFSTYAPTKTSFSGTLTGVFMINKVGMLSLADLRQSQIAQTKLLMRFQRTSDKGEVYTEEASFFISRTSDEGSYDNISTFNIDLKGTGVIAAVFASGLTINTENIYINGIPITITH